MADLDPQVVSAIQPLIAGGVAIDAIKSAADELGKQAARDAVVSAMLPMPDGFAGTAAAMRRDLPKLLLLPAVQPRDIALQLFGAIIAGDDAAAWQQSWLLIASVFMQVGITLPAPPVVTPSTQTVTNG